MRFKNTTDFSDRFLRRMLAWCCKQLDIPVRFVKDVQFRQRRQRRFSGRCWHWKSGCRIVVSIASDAMFPWTDHGKSVGIKGLERRLEDRVECLVDITAHELRHAQAELTGERTRGNGGRVASSERATEFDAQRVLDAFRNDRPALMAAWSADTERHPKPKPSVKERNAAKAADALQRWQRKLKLAQTKVRKYKAAVRRYERQTAMAATAANG